VILVDTSAWIDFFRDRKPLAERVDEVLESGEAAICGPVMAELRRGFRTSRERDQILPLLDGCHYLKDPEDLWAAAGDLGFTLGRKGSTVKTLDLVIAAIALTYDVPILTGDQDFAAIRRLGLPLVLG
jgi:predicted nucleic acid-binding protein